jgi:hypothetical protein
MATRQKILCPECDQPSSIDLKQCGNPKANGGICTFNTHGYWESFTPKTNLFALLAFSGFFYFLQFQTDLPTVAIAPESSPIPHYTSLFIHYLPFGFLVPVFIFLWKTINHFLNRPPRL